MSKEWKEFEILTQRIQQELAPYAQVSTNEKVRGSSGAEHQCDVVVRSNIGQYRFTCIMECKDLRKKVDIDVVRSFLGLLEDIEEASQGAIVASKGFTKPARQLARDKGILIYTLFDAQRIKWSQEAMIPILIDHIEVGSAGVFIVDKDKDQHLSFGDNYDEVKVDLNIYDRVERRFSSMREIVEKKWDELLAGGKLPVETDNFVTEPDRYSIPEENRNICLQFNILPQHRYHFGYVPFIKAQGFIDHTSGEILVGDYEAGPLDVLDAIRKWPWVLSREEISIKPLEVFFMAKFYHRTSPSIAPRSFIFGRTRKC